MRATPDTPCPPENPTITTPIVFAGNQKKRGPPLVLSPEAAAEPTPLPGVAQDEAHP